jgi:hypothetical protein
MIILVMIECNLVGGYHFWEECSTSICRSEVSQIRKQVDYVYEGSAVQAMDNHKTGQSE